MMVGYFVRDFTMNQSLLLKALRNEPCPRPPIWFMRQAGRYLPEYLATRAEAGSFMHLCQNPELACEVTLQPLRRFKLDAAILFSDILVIPDAMGMGLYFDGGPQFRTPLSSLSNSARYKSIDAHKDLGYQGQAIKNIKAQLDSQTPLIGFAGSPWTIACYMLAPGKANGFQSIVDACTNQSQGLKKLLDHLASCIVETLQAQIDAGCDVVMLFDSWGGLLSQDHYQSFSLDFIERILEQLPSDIPSIIFSKGASAYLPLMAQTRAHALGIDDTITLKQAREVVPFDKALQGNLSVDLLQSDAQTISQKVKEVLESHPWPGHIFNLSHGISKETKPETIAHIIDSVHQHCLNPSTHKA